MNQPFPRYKNANVVDLVPYARNSRTHSAAQVAQLAASIKEFGFLNPVILDGANGIIAGHGRILAAQLIGLAQVPSVDAAHLTQAQVRAYVIADNKLALNADWDEGMLRMELNDLDAGGFDLSVTGFSDAELDVLLAADPSDGLTDEDAVPEVPEAPVTLLGDVWILGRHRVMCGDSTSVDAMRTATGLADADLIFTDPPYGMSYGGGRARGEDQKFKGRSGGIKAHGMILGDDFKGDALIALVRDALASSISCAKEGAPLYACFTWRSYSEFEAALEALGKAVKACIVWDKKSIGLGNSHYRPQHEFIFYCGGHWHGDKSQADVWHMSRGATGEYVHPTQKPVELVEKAVENSSKKGDLVLDCFGGSGSTLIACEKTGRLARLMELDPKYCDVIVQRWQEYSGGVATLEATGETFNDLRAAI